MNIQLKKILPGESPLFRKKMIEAHYPETEVRETHTPYFERRNIHFSLNKCHFRIVEFFSEFHREEHDLTEEFKDVNTSGFFRFEKIMDHSKEPR